jgi:hypothetical protein
VTYTFDTPRFAVPRDAIRKLEVYNSGFRDMDLISRLSPIVLSRSSQQRPARP